MNKQASGTMKGTVSVYKATDILERTYTFETTEVYRTEIKGIQAWGYISSERAYISVRFSNKDQPSDEFLLPSPLIESLIFHPEFGHANFAVSGEVILENHAPEQRINGRLDFRTDYRNLRYYKVDVIFDIDGFGGVEAPKA